jgi:hypothetical protein
MRVSQSQDWIPSSEGMTEEGRMAAPVCLPRESGGLYVGWPCTWQNRFTG